MKAQCLNKSVCDQLVTVFHTFYFVSSSITQLIFDPINFFFLLKMHIKEKYFEICLKAFEDDSKANRFSVYQVQLNLSEFRILN